MDLTLAHSTSWLGKIISQTKPLSLTVQDLKRLINAVAGELYPFGGNCGTFAIGLQRFLSAQNFSNMEYFLLSGAEDEDELIHSDPDVYHVCLKVGEFDNETFDGSGVASIRHLNSILKEYRSNLKVANQFWLPCQQSTETIIRSNTNFNVSEDQFLYAFEQAVAMKSNKPKMYTVGISKAYFPKELQQSQEYFEIISVPANGRLEAAQLAWAQNGQRWLSLMSPQQTKVRIVSLNVDEPDAGVGGLLGRLQPITVYRG